MTDNGIPVRLSHLLRECSVGAVVRGPDYLVTVKDTTFWKDMATHEIPYIEQVSHVLGLNKKLCTPPAARLDERGRVIGQTIPVMRFPGWTRCTRCGLLHYRPWRRDRKLDTKTHGTARADPLRCSGPVRDSGSKTCGEDSPTCSGALEQVPWVLVHEEGYLAEAPWHALAHKNHPGRDSCQADWDQPYLEIRRTDSGHELRCDRCRASGAIELRFRYSSRAWQQPWYREPPPNEPNGPGWILEINDVRVHTAETPSALVIPPESRIRRGTVVDRLFANRRLRDEILTTQQDLQRMNALQRKTMLMRTAKELRCTPEEVEKAREEIARGYPLHVEPIRGGELLPSEYQALITEIPELGEDEDLVTEHHTTAWSDRGAALEDMPARLNHGVDRLIAVRRLKEIMVFRGFRRCGGETVVPPDLTGASDWVPAIELYGEGVFFTLRESLVRRWEADYDVHQRAETFRDRMYGAGLQLAARPQVSPRFLLLHTLAHLMIRELETRAGYPAASIRERIFSAVDPESDTEPMAGILLYVAVPDTEGSLGGLIRQAEPDAFLRLLTAAVEMATWCSFDPACHEQEGHGPHLLNRAACHACALVPEPSCAFGNVLLDRTFVTGGARAATGFFDAAWTGQVQSFDES